MSEKNVSGFCDELRSKTKKIHEESDRLVNLKLVVALTDTKLYGDVVSQFYFVFRTIEECVDRMKEDPRIQVLYVKEMFRRNAFERDLKFYLGTDWAEKVAPSTQTQVYCDRIYEITETNPVLLIAYIHTMYLAMLAGGQILKQIIKKTLGLSGEQGLSLFEFDEIDPKELRKQILAKVNSFELDQKEKDAIIEEVFRIFRMNNLLARNIQPSWKNFRRLGTFVFTAVAIISMGFYGMFTYFK